MDLDVPGDRVNECQGLMEPIGVIQKRDKWRVVHRCVKCHQVRICDCDQIDNQTTIIELSQQPVADKVLTRLNNNVR